MPRVRFPALPLALALACVLAIPAAHAAGPDAAPSSEAAQLIDRALDLREAGNDREALPLLQRAVSLDPSPRARAQLALGQQALGEWVEAERGLASVLESRDDAWVQRNHPALEGALVTVRRQLGWLEVEANVPGAQVTLNGVSVGTLPLAGEIRVAAGVVPLKVLAPGYSPVVRLVQIAGGEHAREVLMLQPEAMVSPATAARPDAPTPESGKTLAWTVLVGSGVALTGGIVANVAREHSAAKWNDEVTAYNQACQPQCPGARPSHGDVDLFTGLAVAGYGIGAALGVTSAVLFLHGPASPPPTRTGVRCGIGVRSAFCGGAF